MTPLGMNSGTPLESSRDSCTIEVSKESPVLYPYQVEGIEFLSRTRRALLADDMGTGKTVQALRASSGRTLVIAPNVVKFVWCDEVQKWLPGTSVQVVSGDRETRREQIHRGAQITVANYELLTTSEKTQLPLPATCQREAVWKDRYYYDLGELLSVKWDTIILDEAHRVKNRQAVTTRSARLLTRRTHRVFLLTGTPILNRPEELWSLLHILDPKAFSSFWRYVEEFCRVSKDIWGHYVIGPPTTNQIRSLKDRISGRFLRRLKTDVLTTLPAKTVQQFYVEMSPIQARLYREMATRMRAELKHGKSITSLYVIAQLVRLKQIVVGPEIIWPDVPGISGGKVDALLELLEGSGDQKVVVFSQFVQALNRLYDLLVDRGHRVEMVTGDIPGSDREDSVRRFREDSAVKVMLASIRAGGQGLSFTSASIGVFLDKDWSPLINLQAQDRLHRQGQTLPVTIIDLLTRKTIEEKIEHLLRSKERSFDDLFGLNRVAPQTIETLIHLLDDTDDQASVLESETPL